MNLWKPQRVPTKNAQIEMVGLVIIVIIISLIMLFVLRTLMEPQSEYVQQEEATTLSSQWVDALLRTNSQCFPHAGKSDPSMGELLIDCVKFYGIGGNIICSSSKKSCDHFNETVKALLGNTLHQWNVPYEFKVNKQGQQVLLRHANATRTRNSGGDVTPYTLPIYPTNQNIEIWLCIGGCPP